MQVQAVSERHHSCTFESTTVSALRAAPHLQAFLGCVEACNLHGCLDDCLQAVLSAADQHL